MKKWIFMLFLVSEVFAQKTVPLVPNEDRNAPNGGYKWTSLDSAGTVTKNFYFRNLSNPERHGYNGYCAVYVWTDSATTATQTVASYDSLKIDAYVLKYDEISEQYEVCSTFCVSGKDSINVANWISWGTAGNDDNFKVSKVLNVQNADGVRIVATAKSDLIIREELMYTLGDGN